MDNEEMITKSGRCKFVDEIIDEIENESDRRLIRERFERLKFVNETLDTKVSMLQRTISNLANEISELRDKLDYANEQYSQKNEDLHITWNVEYKERGEKKMISKEELKSFIIYLDLCYIHQAEGLSTNGIMTYLDLQKRYPKFENAAYRRKLANKLFNIIDEVKDYERTTNIQKT